MPLTDCAPVRELIWHLFPSIVIDENLLASGQRLVYFCHFTADTEVPSQHDWHTWGPVVLKVSEDIHPTVLGRLEKEREILNELASRFYPKLLYHDVFVEDPVTETKFRYRLYVTIEERIDGEPLSACRERFVDEGSVLRLLYQLVEGLSLLWNHKNRIIHRDLKPANILVRRDGSPVIIDLGIVREQGAAGVTATHWNIGPCTPAYASSEQLKNQKRFITFKADFFSLGVMAYELLVGSNPFSASQYDPLEDVINRALTLEPTPLVELGKASAPFSDLVSRLMAKQPYKRHRTVDELRAGIKELIGDVDGH